MTTAVEFVKQTMEKLRTSKDPYFVISNASQTVYSTRELQTLESIKYYFTSFFDENGSPIIRGLDDLYVEIINLSRELHELANGNIPHTPSIFEQILLSAAPSLGEMKRFVNELTDTTRPLFIQCIHSNPILCYQFRHAIGSHIDDENDIRGDLLNQSIQKNDFTSLLCGHLLEYLSILHSSDFIIQALTSDDDEYDVYKLLSVYIRTREKTLLKLIKKRMIPMRHPIDSSKIAEFCDILLDEE